MQRYLALFHPRLPSINICSCFMISMAVIQLKNSTKSDLFFQIPDGIKRLFPKSGNSFICLQKTLMDILLNF
uniref:Uncharacterized protein n=1 Tax=Arundo donax TaxID=35708 RepID=A0A0A9D9C4_ARUDO